MTSPFTPVKLGEIKLANRLAMAPMTRSRAGVGEIATPMMAEYYRQRASAGLIVSEGIQPSAVAQGYVNTPGLHTREQVESWRQVTEAVHTEGGVIFAQLMHAGRVGHPDVRGGLLPEAPSAVAAPGQSFTASGLKDNPVPNVMSEEDIEGALRDLARAARNAIEAGFDGVELHGANGYLPQQFLCARANLRTDRWGGPSTANRIRFAVEAVRAIAGAVGPERTALRVSPGSTILGIEEDNPEELYLALFAELAGDGLAFMDVAEKVGMRPITERLREAWSGTLVLNPHRDETPLPPHEAVRDALESVGADVVALGAAWLANPDLADRVSTAGPYNAPDRATFYGGDHRGYIDYPHST
ncbi:N-ethylmaleimide reductase [Sinosporangium album]|uniref:N-ethylmaleimide reductase n=1 Tax=Sinosporangium album TaxID=504805 RepID=A0A1G7Y4B6_9ACTN|nr:alkene reductase [Sinosporangium album]SDG91203.1 N-ethylmaleimide reductase [Sinosporangium album]